MPASCSRDAARLASSALPFSTLEASCSSIVAIDKINVVDERLARVMTWYDNEWGFACRMIDTAVAMGKYL